MSLLLSSISYGANLGSLKSGDKVRLVSPGHVCSTRESAEQALNMAHSQLLGRRPNWYANNLGYDISVVCRDMLNTNTGIATVVSTDKDDLLFVKIKFQPYQTNKEQFTYFAPQEFLEKAQ